MKYLLFLCFVVQVACETEIVTQVLQVQQGSSMNLDVLDKNLNEVGLHTIERRVEVVAESFTGPQNTTVSTENSNAVLSSTLVTVIIAGLVIFCVLVCGVFFFCQYQSSSVDRKKNEEELFAHVVPSAPPFYSYSSRGGCI